MRLTALILAATIGALLLTGVAVVAHTAIGELWSYSGAWAVTLALCGAWAAWRWRR